MPAGTALPSIALPAPSLKLDARVTYPGLAQFSGLGELGAPLARFLPSFGTATIKDVDCRSCAERRGASEAQAAGETAGQDGTPSYQAISSDEALALLESGAKVVWVDERATRDYVIGHAPGALHIQLHELKDRLSEIPTDADAIIGYCNCPHGESGERVAQILAEAGFKNAMYLNSDFADTWAGPMETSDQDPTPGFRDITSAEAQAILDSNPSAFLLDVRSPREFEEIHIPGATLIPMHELPARLAEIPSDADPVIVYCKSGGRSSAVAEVLAEAGFKDVLNFNDGILGWDGKFEVTRTEDDRRSYANVTNEEAKAILADDSNVLLLDVRTPGEHEAAHIPGTDLLIPVQELTDRISEVPADTESILVYCRSGVRSIRASLILADAGFKDVMNLVHGIKGWDGPKESGISAPEAPPAAPEQPASETPPTTQSPGYADISVREARRILDTDPDAFLLDVRTRREFGEAHIPGAKVIPVDELADRLSEIPKGEGPLVVYCRSGVRSARAANMLAEAGFQNVLNVSGGILAWEGPTEECLPCQAL